LRHSNVSHLLCYHQRHILKPKTPRLPHLVTSKHLGVGQSALREVSQRSSDDGTMRIPVVIDTDVGDDIDDSWALAYLLSNPKCDVKLVVTALGDSERHLQRAGCVRKLLQHAGQMHVPVALGIDSWGTGRAATPETRIDCALAAWAAPATLDEVIQDGVGAMLDVFATSPLPVTVVSLAPMCNVAALVNHSAGTDVLQNVNLVGMAGSVREGYGGKGTAPCAEYNVACDPEAFASSLAGPWKSVRLAPVDICNGNVIRGEHFQRLVRCEDPLIAALLESYASWVKNSRVAAKYYPQLDPKCESTVLFDVVAAFLASKPGDAGGLMQLEQCALNVTTEGFTELDEDDEGTSRSGTAAICALNWVEGGLDSFAEQVVQTLSCARKPLE